MVMIAGQLRGERKPMPPPGAPIRDWDLSRKLPGAPAFFRKCRAQWTKCRRFDVTPGVSHRFAGCIRFADDMSIAGSMTDGVAIRAAAIQLAIMRLSVPRNDQACSQTDPRSDDLKTDFDP
jgi:hypothetical protein